MSAWDSCDGVKHGGIVFIIIITLFFFGKIIQK